MTTKEKLIASLIVLAALVASYVLFMQEDTPKASSSPVGIKL